MSDDTKFDLQSAFPGSYKNHNGEIIHDPGMTLRQWYAGMAMQGQLAYGVRGPAADIATAALRFADALLAAEAGDG